LNDVRDFDVVIGQVFETAAGEKRVAVLCTECLIVLDLQSRRTLSAVETLGRAISLHVHRTPASAHVLLVGYSDSYAVHGIDAASGEFVFDMGKHDERPVTAITELRKPDGSVTFATATADCTINLFGQEGVYVDTLTSVAWGAVWDLAVVEDPGRGQVGKTRT
jgi:hypothetical protein